MSRINEEIGTLKEEKEKKIDHSIEETFPASDPPSPSAIDKKKVEAEKKKKREEAIDHSLEDTFPASDPTSYQTP